MTLAESDSKEDEIQSIHNEEELDKKKIPYPKSVFFIISNEFCERFSYYGMRTILILYLTKILLFGENDATVVYHTFSMLVYFFPLLGAIISDSWLGKFNTILYLSIVYACGSILLALSSAGPLGIPQVPFSLLGLLLIAIGSGGIKPCVAAFGGDQFKVPEQDLQLVQFFSFYYFSINAGSLISTFLTPILREDVKCFDMDNCFSLAFSVPGVLMITSVVIFAIGKPMYKIKKPQGNIVVQVAKCITYALRNKSSKPVDHWLDRAEEKYGAKLVNDIKITLKVLVLYVPLPIFWSLYDQQGSRWTFQAVRMNGDIGFYTILPDQMQVVNPILILAFIPFFTYVVYPVFAKCNLLKNSLQRMVVGGSLAAAAFAISAIISMQIESTDPTLASAGNIQLRIYNPTLNNFDIKCQSLSIDQQILPNSMWSQNGISFKGSADVQCYINGDSVPVVSKLESGNSYFIYTNINGSFFAKDEIAKSEDGLSKVRTLSYSGDDLEYLDEDGKRILKVNSGDSSIIEIKPTSCSLNSTKMKFEMGGVYTVLVGESNVVKMFVITEPNSVHILWLLPQYIIITAGEILFTITGLEFSYSQAPISMKSFMQSSFLLTTAIGNLIIVIIESSKIFDKDSYVFFLYAGLMMADMLLFGWLAYRYEYVKSENSEAETVLDDSDIRKKSDRGSENGMENVAFNDKL